MVWKSKEDGFTLGPWETDFPTPASYRKIAEITAATAAEGLRNAARGAEEAGVQLSPVAGLAMAAFMLYLLDYEIPALPALLRALCEEQLLVDAPKEALPGIRARAKWHSETAGERGCGDWDDEEIRYGAAEELAHCLLESSLDRNGFRPELPGRGEPTSEVQRVVYQFMFITERLRVWLRRLLDKGDFLPRMRGSSVEKLATSMHLPAGRTKPQAVAAAGG